MQVKFPSVADLADPKIKWVPSSFIPFDPTWPKLNRLHWIVESACFCRANIPHVLKFKDDTNIEVQLRMQWLRDAIHGVTSLWNAAIVELPRAVTGPLNHLRDGFNVHLDAGAIDALLADLIVIEDEARRLAGQTAGETSSAVKPDPVVVASDVLDLVRLDEAAAIVHRSKKTLERRKAKMPAPHTEGGGGKPALWKWNELRPWLESEYVPDLPKTFPRNVR
jgi:hypothetical protein